jgi:hypothetical protein
MLTLQVGNQSAFLLLGQVGEDPFSVLRALQDPLVITGFFVGEAILIASAFLIWDAYRVVPVEHQKLPPFLVWFAVLPCVHLVLYLILVLTIPQSFKAALSSRGRSDFGDCGSRIGICFVIAEFLRLIPCIGLLFGLCGLVCLVMFIVKLRKMKAALLAG